MFFIITYKHKSIELLIYLMKLYLIKEFIELKIIKAKINK